MFLVFITHHSKIRELSDGNKNWKQCQTDFSAVGPTYFWVMGDENIKTKQLRVCLVFFFLHHSSLLTQFSSLITYHLKYLNSLNSTRLAPSLSYVFNQKIKKVGPTHWPNVIKLFFFFLSLIFLCLSLCNYLLPCI